MTQTQFLSGSRFKFETFEEIRVFNGGVYPGFAVLRNVLALTILLHHARIAVRGVRSDVVVTGGISHSAGIALGLDWSQRLVADFLSGEILRPWLYALVGAFFMLSGFLVAGSALRTRNVRIFLTFRALRIAPALVSEIMLSAFLLGPLVTALPLSKYFNNWDFPKYFGNMLGWFHPYLPGVFDNNPIKFMVNANLWTLEPEFNCYLILAVIMLGGLVYNRLYSLIAFIAGTVIIFCISTFGDDTFLTRSDPTHFTRWFIVYLFFVGVIFYLYADKIVFSRLLCVLAAIGYTIGMVFSIPDVISCFLLAYVTFSIGALNFGAINKILEKHDYSYGFYLYGYPITQTIVFVFQSIGIMKPILPIYVAVAVLSIGLTLCFAALSWHFVERPALSLKRLLATRKSG